MQRQLILVLGALLGSCLPASGQSLSARFDASEKQFGPGLTLLTASSSSRDLPVTNVMPARGPSLAVTPARLPVLFAVVNYRKPTLRRPSRMHVELIQTPFMRQGRVPLARLWGGRLRLDGFASETSMRDVLDGPLRSGHFGTMQPRVRAMFGISFSLRFGRAASL